MLHSVGIYKFFEYFETIYQLPAFILTFGSYWWHHIWSCSLCSRASVMQEVIFFFTKLPSVNDLENLTVKWSVSKLTQNKKKNKNIFYNTLFRFQCLTKQATFCFWNSPECSVSNVFSSCTVLACLHFAYISCMWQQPLFFLTFCVHYPWNTFFSCFSFYFFLLPLPGMGII